MNSAGAHRPSDHETACQGSSTGGGQHDHPRDSNRGYADETNAPLKYSLSLECPARPHKDSFPSITTKEVVTQSAKVSRPSRTTDQPFRAFMLTATLYCESEQNERAEYRQSPVSSAKLTRGLTAPARLT